MEELRELWIEAEEWATGEWRPDDDVTDAIATLSDGSRWIGTFCAFAHLASLRANCAASGECLHRKYLRASDLVLVDTTKRESISAVVRDLLSTGDLRNAMSPMEPDTVARAG